MSFDFLNLNFKEYANNDKVIGTITGITWGKEFNNQDENTSIKITVTTTDKVQVARNLYLYSGDFKRAQTAKQILEQLDTISGGKFSKLGASGKFERGNNDQLNNCFFGLNVLITIGVMAQNDGSKATFITSFASVPKSAYKHKDKLVDEPQADETPDSYEPEESGEDVRKNTSEDPYNDDIPF